MRTSSLLFLLAAFLLVACRSADEPISPVETEAPIVATATLAQNSSDEGEQADTSGVNSVIQLDAFNSAGLVQDPTIIDCTLTDGTETQCAEIVTKYLPDNLEIGPFCPDSIFEAGGVWDWDGENAGVYRLDEAFFTMLTEQGYEFYDTDGNVYIGDPAGSLQAGVNNCLEATADDTVEMTVRIPIQPVMANAPTDLGTVARVGIGIDTIPIFADAPSVQQTGHMPALDSCGGHIDPGGWYHWHATTTDIDSSFEHEGVDAHCHLDQSASALFGYAFDGFPIYGSADPDGSIPADLDECSGHFGVTDEYPDGIYHYHAGLEFPNLPPCLVGVSANNAFATTASAGIGAGGGGRGGPGGGGDRGDGGPPDFAAAAEILGISEDALRDALGGPPPDFEAASEILGVSIEELEEALGRSAPAEGDGQAPPREDEPSEDSAEAPAAVEIGDGRLFTLPGDNIYPEGVSYDSETGKFYVGATSDGTLYVGDVNGALEMTIFSEGGADGRTAAIGTKVDDNGRLWVAGGNTGQVFVYDTANGSLISTITTPAADGTFINDLAITDSGVYFTDSFRPILWRVSDPLQGEAEAWLDFTGTAINYVQGFNLNGIVPTEDGSVLIVVHSGEGELYRIDVATKNVVRIDTGDTPLTAGDGLALIGNTIYVTRNNFGEIVPLELSADLSTAVGGPIITSDLFGYPTTIAYTGYSFLIANSQFNNRNAGTPDLPFTVAEIPLQTAGQDAAGGSPAAVINLDAFDPAGFVQDPAVVDCTLTDGTVTQCAQFVVKHLPDDFEIGPNCPTTLAETGGIWNWDGDFPGLYSLNEAFWRLVNDQGFSFYDDQGNINIADPGPDGPNAVLEGNNCIEIAEDETAELTVEIPLNPIVAETPTRLGVVSQVGLSLNSIPIFSDAPSVFRTNNLPALDPCGGHIDPGGWYHWHATATDIESSFAHEGVEADCYLEQSESGLFAYAFDGFPIYGSADPDGTIPTDLDECNGHFGVTADYPEGIYHYHATLDFPNLPTCLVGARSENAFSTNTGTATPGGNQGQGGRGEGGPPPGGEGEGQGGQGGPPAGGNGQGGRGGGPDFAAAAETLGISEDALRDALGGPPPDFEAAAEILGISVDVLQEAVDGTRD